MRLVAKHAQVGYTVPGDRPGCRNCAHFEITRHDSPVIAPRTACMKHDLEVTAGGICDDFAALYRGYSDKAAKEREFSRKQIPLQLVEADVCGNPKPGGKTISVRWQEFKADQAKRFPQHGEVTC